MTCASAELLAIFKAAEVVENKERGWVTATNSCYRYSYFRALARAPPVVALSPEVSSVLEGVGTRKRYISKYTAWASIQTSH